MKSNSSIPAHGTVLYVRSQHHIPTLSRTVEDLDLRLAVRSFLSPRMFLDGLKSLHNCTPMAVSCTMKRKKPWVSLGARQVTTQDGNSGPQTHVHDVMGEPTHKTTATVNHHGGSICQHRMFCRYVYRPREDSG